MVKMGLDVGDRRIGVAVSDALGYTAQGKGVIKRDDLQSDLEKIKEYIEKHQVDELIIGLPKNMDNSLGPQAEKVKNFAGFLRNRLDIPVKLWDERLTTRQAEEVLIQGDVSRARRKEVIDKMAAVLILQNYLDFKDHQKRTGGKNYD